MIRLTLFVLVGTLAACFEPHYPVGLPCSSVGTCPPGQACDFGTCVPEDNARNDAGGGRDDAGDDVPCTLFPQSGCPGGYKCTFAGSSIPNQGSCRPSGNAGFGDACSVDAFGDDPCSTGLMCVFEECLPFCGGDTCPGSHACIDVGSYSVCLLRCDPLAQDCRASAGGPLQTCFIDPSGTGCAAPLRFLAEGAACTVFNDCQSGLSCIGGFCRRNCDFEMFPKMQGTCMTDQRCTSVTASYGVCQ